MTFHKKNWHPDCEDCIDGGKNWDTICNYHLIEKLQKKFKR